MPSIGICSVPIRRIAMPGLQSCLVLPQALLSSWKEFVMSPARKLETLKLRQLQKGSLLFSSRDGFSGCPRTLDGMAGGYSQKSPPITIHRKGNCVAALGISQAPEQDRVPLLRTLLAGLVKPYFSKNPTAVAAMELIRKQDPGPICYDHIAFRTFGGNGCGINSIAQVFLDLGYSVRDELHFPGKKLRALWFSPPEHLYDVEGELDNGPLPRIFISEILVDQLSLESQQIIHRYTKAADLLAGHATVASVLNTLTWPTPSLSDYQHLARESEYAAWTLVHGYALNHATLSVHRLHKMHNIGELNQFLQDNSIKLNSDGGILKVSPDGGLQQSSSVADSLQFTFADGQVGSVPASYIEFAERLVLPTHAGLKHEEIRERHRREGFEVGNADKIFESTSYGQTGFKEIQSH